MLFDQSEETDRKAGADDGGNEREGPASAGADERKEKSSDQSADDAGNDVRQKAVFLSVILPAIKPARAPRRMITVSLIRITGAVFPLYESAWRNPAGSFYFPKYLLSRPAKALP